MKLLSGIFLTLSLMLPATSHCGLFGSVANFVDKYKTSIFLGALATVFTADILYGLFTSPYPVDVKNHFKNRYLNQDSLEKELKSGNHRDRILYSTRTGNRESFSTEFIHFSANYSVISYFCQVITTAQENNQKYIRFMYGDGTQEEIII